MSLPRQNKTVKCETCNITLNSEQQAQQHYSGKNHLKKMRQVTGADKGEKGADKDGKEGKAGAAGDDETKAQTGGSGLLTLTKMK